MKNKEKYAKEILEIACNGDAVAISKTGVEMSAVKIVCVILDVRVVRKNA